MYVRTQLGSVEMNWWVGFVLRIMSLLKTLHWFDFNPDQVANGRSNI